MESNQMDFATDSPYEWQKYNPRLEIFYDENIVEKGLKNIQPNQNAKNKDDQQELVNFNYPETEKNEEDKKSQTKEEIWNEIFGLKNTPPPKRRNARPTKITVHPKEKKKSQKKSNTQNTIELKANENLRLDAIIRKLWTNFKKGNFPSLGEINKNISHRPENLIYGLQYASKSLIDMSRYDSESLDDLPLFEEFFARIGLDPKLILRFRSPSAILPSEKNSDLNHILEQIKNELNNNQQFLAAKQSDLKKVNRQLVKWIEFLQSKIGVKLKYPDKTDPKREQTDLKLLYAKAAFNGLILNSYQTKNWATRLKWFDKSGLLLKKLSLYLRKEFSSQQERQSSEVERLKLACNKLMDLLK